jgi:hypothetical protein
MFCLRSLRGEEDLISRDCDGCSLQQTCLRRFQKVGLGEKVYCPDGTAHLVDKASLECSV